MKFYRWIVLTLGIGLIIVGGFFPNIFKINAFTILILFILAIPTVAPYLKEAKFPGAKFIFKDEILKTEELVQKSVEVAKKQKKALPFETFNLSSAREQLESDHILALAALRIEIEKKLKKAAEFLDIPEKERKRLPQIINALQRKKIIFPEQISALKKILNMCNKAVHGEIISTSEANQIIDLADELKKSFSIGYSIDFTPNRDYVEQGLFCEWEHCIELMPLSKENTELSCPIWGHNCPGGLEMISKCDKKKEDFPKERFMNMEQFIAFLEQVKNKRSE